jgi:hypothetical protein
VRTAGDASNVCSAGPCRVGNRVKVLLRRSGFQLENTRSNHRCYT